MSKFWRILVCGVSLLAGLAIGRTDELGEYRAIVKRNVFGLTPIPSPSALLEPTVEPKQDLLLTGLVCVDSLRCALFIVVEPGKPNSYFMLNEGGQNEWLECQSVNLKSSTVKVLLKKPVMRIRNVGVEVILSFQSHGQQNPFAR